MRVTEGADGFRDAKRNSPEITLDRQFSFDSTTQKGGFINRFATERTGDAHGMPRRNGLICVLSTAVLSAGLKHYIAHVNGPSSSRVDLYQRERRQGLRTLIGQKTWLAAEVRR
jgi:hypothetical protein